VRQAQQNGAIQQPPATGKKCKSEKGFHAAASIRLAVRENRQGSEGSRYAPISERT
jgi:hypothetical protein